jgi:hypothetical protein
VLPLDHPTLEPSSRAPVVPLIDICLDSPCDASVPPLEQFGLPLMSPESFPLPKGDHHPHPSSLCEPIEARCEWQSRLKAGRALPIFNHCLKFLEEVHKAMRSNKY